MNEFRTNLAISKSEGYNGLNNLAAATEEGLYAIANAIMESTEILDKDLIGLIRARYYEANALTNCFKECTKTLTDTIKDGICDAITEAEHISNVQEQYVLTDKLQAFHEKYPDIKLDMDVSSKLINMSEDMKVMLAYCITEAGKGFFRFFTAECSVLEGDEPEKWFYSFAKRAKIRLEDLHTIDLTLNEQKIVFRIGEFEEYKSIMGVGVGVFGDPFFLPVRGHGTPCGFPWCLHITSFDKFQSFISEFCHKHVYCNCDKYFEGYSMVNAWIKKRNSEITLSHLRQVYTSAVMQVLNT